VQHGGLIGIRFRAGWEFERNGGKYNRFQNLSIMRVDVGIDVGGPFLPDLVDGYFHMIRVEGARIGFRVVGANVAEMWFREISIGTVEEAGFKLGGYPARLIRSIKKKDTPTSETVLLDMDGREIFLEQIEHLKELMKQQVQTEADSAVPGSNGRPWIGGGASSCLISTVEAHMHDPRSWLIDAWFAPVRIEYVRLEGSAGFMRSGPQDAYNGRFNDVVIDANAVSIGGVSGHVIEYNRRNTLVLIGGTLEGQVALGQDAQCQVIGTRFNSHPGRTRTAIIPKGVQLPEGSFFHHTGKSVSYPFRRGPEGETVTSDPQPAPGIVQMRGTSGAKVYRMPEGAAPPAE